MKKKSIIFTAVFRIMGIVVLILGIRMVGEGVYNYINEHNQSDWISTTAYVVDVSSDYTGSLHNRSVNYDITYQYEVDSKKYTDKLYNRGKAMELGDTVKIKYDPNAPECSTDILVPSVKNLIIFLVFGAVLTTIGFFLSGLWALIHKIRRRREPEEKEVLPPEEYVDTATINNHPKNNIKALLRRIIIVIIILGTMFLSIKLFPGIQSKSTEEFMDIAETSGYTAYDTTQQLQQEWKVGSMLEDSVSINDGNIRIDFCIMDTVDSANLLYDGMTLPLSEGEKLEHNGIVYESSSVENDSLYTAKIRIRDTVIYVSAREEFKSQAVEILEKLGYWKE